MDTKTVDYDVEILTLEEQGCTAGTYLKQPFEPALPLALVPSFELAP